MTLRKCSHVRILVKISFRSFEHASGGTARMPRNQCEGCGHPRYILFFEHRVRYPEVGLSPNEFGIFQTDQVKLFLNGITVTSMEIVGSAENGPSKVGMSGHEYF